jgi:hypothetical protein
MGCRHSSQWLGRRDSSAFPPPGLIPAHGAARASPPSIARSTTEIQPTDFGGIYMAGSLENPRTFQSLHFSLPDPAAQQHQTGGDWPFFPAAGALPAAVSGAARSKNRSKHPPSPTSSPIPPPKPLKPQETERENIHGDWWRKAALLPAPSPARASIPPVNARPSRGPVAAPTARVPYAVVAAASFCSIKPRTAAGQPALMRCS